MCNACNKNFVLFTDSAGMMPQMRAFNQRHRVPPSHKYYVEYRNDKPVRVKPYPGQNCIWDYSTSTMLALKSGVQCHSGNPMKMYTGEIVA